MIELPFPSYSFRIKSNENKNFIFDEIRKKFVVLTPEEWVRQHIIQWLLSEKKYPKSHINVEKKLIINGTLKRYDLVVFDRAGVLQILVECKAPHVAINQLVFDQIARYNLQLNARFLMITNGLQHYYCKMDYENQQYVFLKNIPDYSV